MSQAGLGVRAFFRIKAREADEKELCTLRPRFLYKVYGKPRRVPCAKQMKIPDMLRPVHPDVRSAFATRPGTFSVAGSVFAPGRTECASRGFCSRIRFRAGRRRFRGVARLRKLGFRIPCFRGSIRIQIGGCPAFRVSYSGNGSKSSNKVRPCAPRVAIARSVQTP